MIAEKYIFYVFCYLIGSVPFGYVIAKYFSGEDISKKGSGNIGATNVSRVAGKKLGAVTLLLDFLKGLLPVIIYERLYQEDNLGLMIVAGACVIGHIFSIFRKFKGGKGIATGLGTLFALNPIIGGICVALWILIFLATRISSAAALISFMISPFAAFLLESGNTELIIYCFILSVGIILTHINNIKRLLSGKENKF